VSDYCASLQLSIGELNVGSKTIFVGLRRISGKSFVIRRSEQTLKTISVAILFTSLLVLATLCLARSARAGNSAASAAETYARQCSTCHGHDGRAKSMKGKLTKARNLTDAEWQERVSDERIYNVIANGKGKMPSFSKKLSDAEINSLVEYVRTLKK
jgi:mono/diheme cytochrome c family protein